MRMANTWAITVVLGVLCASGRSHAWSGHETTAHGLRVFIPEIADVQAPHAPTEVEVLLENQDVVTRAGVVALRDFVDAWHAVGPAKATFSLGPGESTGLSFKMASGHPFYAALYPVHAYVNFEADGKKRAAHAVRIFRVTTACPKATPAGGKGKCPVCHAAVEEEAKDEIPVLELKSDRLLALWRQKALRVGWNYYDQPVVLKPVGWLGSDPVCKGNVTFRTVVRGDARKSINMHPPWRPGGGTIWCDFKVKLPATGPVKLRFANAIRDHSKAEPGSDGVLFRVWAFEGETVPDKPLFERFTDAKVWTNAEADLTPWLGQTITLRLESHPGPSHDTQCDSSYWAEPLLAAGTALVSEDQSLELPPALVARAQAVATGTEEADAQETFRLIGASGGPFGVAVKPGSLGLLNGWFVFAGPRDWAAFRGLDVELEYGDVGGASATHVFHRLGTKMSRKGVRYRHHVGKGEVDVQLRAESAGLRVSVSSDKRITRLGPGAWATVADRVFAGHGYVIAKPGAFRMSFGGHTLSTSHVAFEFGDLGVLQATDTPPSSLQVDPGKRIHALYTRENSTLTFVPATGALNAAFAYRPLYDKKPAPGVSGLAGRMCFDIWGGTYGQIRDRMREAVRLGLVDSFLTVHNWQRWGYDYRLPDVWPPNPKYGTIEDLQELGRVCREQSIPWGLHDNYIDFYPDAEDYSYKHVYFTKSGEPHKAWHNRGREAYSYKWRPDAILPFVKRNLKQIRRDVAPTHSFLDVFTSTGCVDWWDWEGNHHPSTETRKLWGETFAWIRDCLGDDAPTTSEGGHDQLTGYLDGADCQWLTLAQKGRRFVIGLPCGDWERVPWFDAVNHTNFVLHGVGYSSRYAAERSRAVHGINSDDYMSCEVLSGHALMVDSSSWGRAAARKYYLLQDVARRLALRNIRSVDFVGGDIHRQRVVWDDGTEVFVNRGTSDWPVAGRTLPGYGFLVRKGVNFATVERVNGMFAESSRGESGWFCNARTVSAEREHRVFARPFVENFRHRGSGEITYDLSWNVARGNANNWRAFVHFYDTLDEEKGKIIFQDDHTPSVPVKEWEAGVVRTSRTLAIPDGLAGTFEMTAGLYSPEGGRALLSGVAVGSGRMHLGTLCVERNGEEVSQVSLRPPDGEATEPELPPTNPTGTTIDFGFARTSGAFRVQPLQGGLRVTPLPRSKTFPITLRLDALTAGASPRVKSIVAVPVDETATTAEHAFEQEDGELTFTHDPSTFAYDVQW